MRVTPDKDFDAWMRGVEGRLARLEQERHGVIRVASGSQIGDVIFQTERATDGTLLLYAKDAKGSVRVLVATVA